MIFEIVGIRNGKTSAFKYDNIKNILTSEEGHVFSSNQDTLYKKESFPFSPENPLKKSKTVYTLKIQLGLSCNYSCEYCSQRFVERADETSFKNVSDFISKLENLSFDEEKGLKIELWGGEPFVYWKTIQPLVAALKEKFESWNKKPVFSIITNGSILTPEIIEWLLNNMDSMAISHDGPGQWVRGPDPFEDKEHAELVLGLYRTVNSRTRNLKSMSFNSMLNAKNFSRKEIRAWFIAFTGDETVRVGEGSLVDAYDEGGISLSLNTKQEHFNFRKTAFADIYSIPNNTDIGWPNLMNRVNFFIQSVLEHRDAKFLGQKCGMDDENKLAVDLMGNVITCQNVSSVAINSNGESHLSGNIENMDDVRITTSTHWTERKECSSCPVLHVCQGSCMFVTDEYWYHSCNNAYSDAVATFALGFEKITGYIPTLINGDGLPDMRKDIFGDILVHEEEPKRAVKNDKKPFPVAVVAG